MARTYVQRLGFVIRALNWRCTAGELDIVAQQGTRLVFFEVRTRHTLDDALASLTPRKRERLQAAIYAYLDAHALDCDWQLDVLVVVMGRYGSTVTRVEDAFAW